MAESIEIVKLSYRVNLYCFFMTFPTLMTFILFPELLNGSGEFPSILSSSIIWGLEKVRERWKG